MAGECRPASIRRGEIDLSAQTPGTGTVLSSAALAGAAGTEECIPDVDWSGADAYVAKNWCLVFHPIKTATQRSDVGGETLGDFVSRHEAALDNTAAGELRPRMGGSGRVLVPPATQLRWHAGW